MQIPDVMDILKRRNAAVEKAIFLNVPETILSQRIQQRFQCAQCGTSYSIKEGETILCNICQGSNFVRRNDDQQEAMKRRFRVYKESISDLIGYYKDNNVLLELDGTLPIDTVHQFILNHLNPLEHSVTVPMIKSTA
jgi:adenylate kinase